MINNKLLLLLSFFIFASLSSNADGWTKTKNNCFLKKKYHAGADIAQIITVTDLVWGICTDNNGNVYSCQQLYTYEKWQTMKSDKDKECSGTAYVDVEYMYNFSDVGWKVGHVIAKNSSSGPDISAYTNDSRLSAGLPSNSKDLIIPDFNDGKDRSGFGSGEIKSQVDIQGSKVSIHSINGFLETEGDYLTTVRFAVIEDNEKELLKEDNSKSENLDWDKLNVITMEEISIERGTLKMSDKFRRNAGVKTEKNKITFNDMNFSFSIPENARGKEDNFSVIVWMDSRYDFDKKSEGFGETKGLGKTEKVSTLAKLENIEIYPTLVNQNGVVNITQNGSDKDMIVKLFDIQGQCIKTTNTSGDTVISLDGLSAGTYIIWLSSENGTRSEKIVVH